MGSASSCEYRGGSAVQSCCFRASRSPRIHWRCWCGAMSHGCCMFGLSHSWPLAGCCCCGVSTNGTTIVSGRVRSRPVSQCSSTMLRIAADRQRSWADQGALHALAVPATAKNHRQPVGGRFGVEPAGRGTGVRHWRYLGWPVHVERRNDHRWRFVAVAASCTAA